LPGIANITGEAEDAARQRGRGAAAQGATYVMRLAAVAGRAVGRKGKMQRECWTEAVINRVTNTILSQKAIEFLYNIITKSNIIF
jgi:hypothetical protein